jgi:hypothetical protein
MPETDDLSGQMICLDEIGQREYSSSDNSYVCKRGKFTIHCYRTN